MAHHLETELIYFGGAASRWFDSAHQALYAEEDFEVEAAGTHSGRIAEQLELDIGATTSRNSRAY